MAIKNIIAQGIGFSPGSISFIPTLGFTPAAVVPFTAPFTVQDTLVNIQSYLMASGYFNDVVIGEPSSVAAGPRMSASVFQSGRNVALITLTEVTSVYDITVRFYRDMLAQPTEGIEYEMAFVAQQVGSDLLGDFDLGQTVRNIDAAGEHSSGMNAQWGYATLSGVIYRVADINVPVVVNDTATLTA